jgi:protein-S-isoprenylcysteine O-methyltransferase Ste14
MTTNLRTRATGRLLTTLIFFGVLLFIPAGSLHFWQAWLFVGLMSVFWTGFLLYLLKSDPQLIERRLARRESEPQQQRFQKLFILILFPALIVTGLDFRFGWSRSLAPFPTWLVLLGQVAVAAGYSFVFWVMKTNTFAGTTIQVEAEQKVISHGPYQIVRHPMYLGMVLTALGIPIALGSYVALPFFALFVPVLIYRLVHEERTLRQGLPGYAEYCDRQPFRLLPWIW